MRLQKKQNLTVLDLKLAYKMSKNSPKIMFFSIIQKFLWEFVNYAHRRCNKLSLSGFWLLNHHLLTTWIFLNSCVECVRKISFLHIQVHIILTDSRTCHENWARIIWFSPFQICFFFCLDSHKIDNKRLKMP